MKRLTANERVNKYGDPSKIRVQRQLIRQRVLLGPDNTSPEITVLLHPIWAQGFAAAVFRVSRDLDEWPTDIQSFNVRKIAGSENWSLHSWALAVDVFDNNARDKDPVTGRSTMSREWFEAMERETPARWGGRFRKADPHHLEYPW